MQLIAQRGPDGSHLVSAVVDPRTGLLVLTYRVGDQENERALGASLARTAFDQSPNTRVITLRGMKGGTLVYVADSHREAYVETESAEWKQQNSSDPNAWITHMLSQEWTPNGAPSPDTPAGNPPGGPDSDNPNPPAGTTTGGA